MRTTLKAMTSGLARRVALACVGLTALLLLLAALVISREDQRQFRETSRQLTADRATQAARGVAARLDAATLVLQSRAGLQGGAEGNPMFRWSAVLQMDGSHALRDGRRRLQLTAPERAALATGQSLVVHGTTPDGSGLYLVRPSNSGGLDRMRVAELSADFLWAPLGGSPPGADLVAVDADGTPLSEGGDSLHGMESLFATRWKEAAPHGAAAALAWQSGGSPWIGALAAVPAAGGAALHPVGIVAAVADRTWSSHFGAALRQLLPVMALALALALCSAALVSQRYGPALRRLQRALLRLGDSRARMPRIPGAPRELEQVIDAFNLTADRIERQREALQALTEIDSLLIGSGDVESVMDQVLSLVRSVMLARNVGVTLVDANAPGHGRLFCVSAEGGFPVTRVSLDPEMAADAGRVDVPASRSSAARRRATASSRRCRPPARSSSGSGRSSSATGWPRSCPSATPIRRSSAGQVAHYGTDCAPAPVGIARERARAPSTSTARRISIR